jgi:hypothetical protein
MGITAALNQAQKDAILGYHNKARAKVSPAANPKLSPMVWDEKLGSYFCLLALFQCWQLIFVQPLSLSTMPTCATMCTMQRETVNMEQALEKTLLHGLKM